MKYSSYDRFCGIAVKEDMYRVWLLQNIMGDSLTVMVEVVGELPWSEVAGKQHNVSVRVRRHCHGSGYRSAG